MRNYLQNRAHPTYQVVTYFNGPFGNDIDEINSVDFISDSFICTNLQSSCSLFYASVYWYKFFIVVNDCEVHHYLSTWTSIYLKLQQL